MVEALQLVAIPKVEWEQLLSRISKIDQHLEKIVSNQPPRTFYTVKEVSQIKGFTPYHVRRMIRKKAIEFWFEGKDMCISMQDSARIKSKKAGN